MPIRSLPALLALVLLLPLAPRTAAAGEKPILRIYTWSEFFDGGVLAAFEDAHDCIVAIDTFDSNEAMLEDLTDGRDEVHPYDIVTPSSYMAEEMRRKGLLRALDHRLIPNLANIDPAFPSLTEDPEMRHSVPYTRTVTGIGYNRSLGDLRKSWSVFGRKDLTGRLTMLDDMRESLGAALKYLGHSLNTTDPAQVAAAGGVLREWRGNLARFEVDEANIGLGSGELLAVHGYNGDMAVLMESNESIGFFVPEEGSAITTDAFIVMAGSENPDLAHAFINHLLDTETAARNMTGILYYMPVPEALELLSDEIKHNPAFAVPEKTLAKCEVIRNLGENIAIYEKVWEMVRSGN